MNTVKTSIFLHPTLSDLFSPVSLPKGKRLFEEIRTSTLPLLTCRGQSQVPGTSGRYLFPQAIGGREEGLD